MAEQVQRFIDELTRHHQVVIIGGLAVIGHGLSRHTKDAGIWLDPLACAADWATTVSGVCSLFPDVSVHRLPGWSRVEGHNIAVRDFAEAGDPFSQVILAGRETP